MYNDELVFESGLMAEYNYSQIHNFLSYEECQDIEEYFNIDDSLITESVSVADIGAIFGATYIGVFSIAFTYAIGHAIADNKKYKKACKLYEENNDVVPYSKLKIEKVKSKIKDLLKNTYCYRAMYEGKHVFDILIEHDRGSHYKLYLGFIDSSFKKNEEYYTHTIKIGSFHNPKTKAWVDEVLKKYENKDDVKEE